MKIDFGRDWSEFLSLLISRHVRFVVVGGHAVAAHGEPRFTDDLDVLVATTLANGRKLHAALRAFGFGAVLPTPAELIRPGKIWMLGRKPWRIDILTTVDGVSFAEVWRGRVEVAFDVGRLPVIGRRELIQNKRAAGRAKDLADLERLESLARGRRRPLSPTKKK